MLHGDGQSRDASRRIHVEAVAGRQRADLRLRLLEIHGAGLTDRFVAENHVLGNRQWRNQHEMLVHHADAEPDRIRGATDDGRPAVKDNLPAIGANQPVDHVHERRLPGAVFPQKRVDLAPLGDQVHVVIRPEVSEGFDDPTKLQRRRRAYEYLVSPSAPVLRVPLVSFVWMSAILALMSDETFESH